LFLSAIESSSRVRLPLEDIVRVVPKSEHRNMHLRRVRERKREREREHINETKEGESMRHDAARRKNLT